MKPFDPRHTDEPTPLELGKHRGSWVAVVGRRIVAHGTDPVKVFAEASKTHHEPMIFKVPAGEVMIL
jgi:hypothetical protein